MTVMAEQDLTRRVTQDDVAARAGVSRSVVSYVLNAGTRSVAPETRERILTAISELGYRPNKHARNLMKTRNDAVAERQFGIVLSDVFMLRRPYYADILAGIHATAHEHQRQIRFIRFYEELKDVVLFNELIHTEEVSGLILIGLDQHIRSEEDEQLFERIEARIGNIVCVDWVRDGIPSVGFNRLEAAYKATRHLLSLGRRDLYYIGQMDERVQGFNQALLEYDVAVNPERLLNSAAMADGYRECGIMLDAGRKPAAVVGGSDEVSIGILRQLHERGISVPGQVALASIDNIEMAEFCSPPLTTVNVQTDQMGAYAVQILIERGAYPGRVAAATILPTRLIVRESCGARTTAPA